MSRGLAVTIEAEGLAAVNEQFELPLVGVLADIERAGVRVDAEALAVQSRRLETRLAGCRRASTRWRGSSSMLTTGRTGGKVLLLGAG